MTVILALIAGLVLGGVMTALNLPLPAPTSIVGIVGIFGVWLGYSLVERIMN